jgi:aminoglycoside 6-adenylyltransferase
VEDVVVRRIVRWGEAREDVRAVVLTSTRAREGAFVDALSDYDVVLYASEPARFLGDRGWTAELGPVLVQMPPRGREHAWGYPTRLVLYEDGARIDFTILDAGVPATLSDELDAGYRVLLDKALFRTVAIEVAGELSLEYPHRLDAQMTEYLTQRHGGTEKN